MKTLYIYTALEADITIMHPKQESKLEANIDHGLRTKGHDLRPLKSFLLTESCAGTSIKCSKFLLGKLDKLICMELDQREVKNALLVLNVILKFASCMTLNNEEWLTASIKQGLVQKMIIWLEKSTYFLAYSEKQKNETVLNFAEDFFDVVMLVHDHSSEGKMQILEHFLVRACSLVSNAATNIFVKQEVVRRLNLMLNTMPLVARKKILSTEEMTSAMASMAKRILDAGDFDLQVAITEALCRMTSEAQRELTSQWFPMEFIAEAFKRIKDSEFETDCRKFLNLINGILGGKKSVVTLPCLSAYLDNHKFQMPCDEKLEEFWIDFNTGTQSISFYISAGAAEEHQWDTVCVKDSDVIVYSIAEVDNNKLLTVDLKAPIAAGQYEGKQIRIYFSCPLDILSAAQRVFAAQKNKDFIKKQTASDAETTVRVIFEECRSQILLSESQGSNSSVKPVAEPDVKDFAGKNQPPSAASSLKQTTCNHEHNTNSLMPTTPVKVKMSESSMVGSGLKITNIATNNPASRRIRTKPPLEMVRPAERNTVPPNKSRGGSPCSDRTPQLAKHKSSTDAACTFQYVNKAPKGNPDELNEIVPDTQYCATKDSSLLPGLTKRSVNQHERNRKQENSGGFGNKISVSSVCIANQGKISSHLVKQHSNEISTTPTKEMSARSSESSIQKHCEKHLKEKPKELIQATDLLVENIRRKYARLTEEDKREENTFERKNVDKHPLHTNKDKNRTRGFNQHSPKDFSTTTKKPWKDVYDFQFSATDNPTINLEVSAPTVSERMSSKALAIGKKSTKNKQKGKTGTEIKTKAHQRHLFSDTESERGGDDTKSNLSWLQEQHSKTKPPIATYRRQKAQKQQEQTMPYKMRHITTNNSPEPKTGKKSYNRSGGNKHNKLKRPCRTAAKSTNYKDLSNSESDAEVPFSPPKREEPVRRKFEICKAQKELVENPKNLKKNDLKKDQRKYLENDTPKDWKVTTRKQREPSPFPPESPSPSIEQFRSKEYDFDAQVSPRHQTFVELSSSSASSLKGTPNAKDIKATTFCKTEIKYTCCQWTKSSNKSGTRTGNGDVSRSGKGTAPSFSRAISKPNLNNLTLDQSLVSANIKHPAADPSAKEQMEQENGTPTNKYMKQRYRPEDRKPVSNQSGPGRKIPSAEVNTSTKLSVKSLKRNHSHISDNDVINPKGDENEEPGFHEKHKKFKLLPRKLFQSPDKGNRSCRETLSNLSGNETSTSGLDTWEESGAEVGLMCQKINKEFSRKNRSMKMDYFTKNSLKAAQQYLTSLNAQAREFRTKRLEQIQEAITKETEMFQQESQALKNVEKEFAAVWEKQVQALGVYRQKERERIRRLRSLFENNAVLNVEREEEIFNSEMHLLKEDLKKIQQRLLKEMQQEELQSMRRGLESIIMSDARDL
ncbi:synaptonemal complex protein 2 isoform X2 [Xenopus tropicalis]|uniref:Synaptonemal complex protein 2 isoform X2 n=1 Tax=Xenopus tropicalis TaxID=8364 RepID=A0A8J1IZZ6_XENTR|nr:synaptonemal complex protein 2 isoform X2 [Xenopus tropicalis]